MRLPQLVIPRRYNIELWLDMETCEFQGSVTARIQVCQATRVLLLNSADLVIDNASATSDLDKVVIHPKAVEEDQENELLKLEFEKDFGAGDVSLTINYHGKLNENLDGFYKSTYEVDGIRKNMAASTFEPADARRCFPCWDEPEFKATFVFKVHAPSDRLVLSNMPAVEQKLEGSTQTVTFQESVLMSTYITAIVVGEFESMEATSDDGILVRAYTSRGNLSKAKFAMDFALKLLPFFSDFFQVPYPLPKLDLVSVAEFKAGAIENFGSILFRNEAMFVDENSSASQREEIAIVVAHEVAHMWFGNTVTMEWWTHLWLNEGMATWVSYYAVDHFFPDWEIWMQFNNDVRVDGFGLDSLQKTHPVEVDVGHVRETNSAFDAISYCKGASLMVMLHSYLGNEDLKKGLRAYVKKFAFSNATSDDLWDCFEQATGKPVKDLMHSWTKQDGYPVVKATLLENGDLELDQARFLASGQEAEGKWMIPGVICSAGGENSPELTQILMLEKRDRFPVRGSSTSWIKINAGEAGFFRVQYDKKMLEMLKAAVASGDLKPLDRLGVLEDMYALCRSGKEALEELFSLLEAYRNESHPTVLSSMIKVVTAIGSALQSGFPGVFKLLKHRLASFIEPPARSIGWEAAEGEAHLNSVIRMSILNALVMLEHSETCQEAESRFQARLRKPISSTIRPAIFRNAVKGTTSLNRASFDTLIDIYSNSSDTEERMDVLVTIAGSSDPALIREALNFSLSPKVLPQDVSPFFRGVNQASFLTAWTWLKENWDAVHGKVGEGFCLNRVVISIASKISEHNQAEEFKEFMSSRCSSASSEKIMLEKLEEARLRAQWTKLVIDHFSSLPSC